jgi:hypothetical protein
MVTDRRAGASPTAVDVSLAYRRHLAEQARRREFVSRSLQQVLRTIVLGLDGQVPLEDAVFGADAELRPAVREALRRSLAS